MEFKIPFPINSSINTYKELKSYLKQLELSVHYAQKMVEHAEKEALPITEDAFIYFEHPSISQDIKDDLYENLQIIELSINIQ